MSRKSRQKKGRKLLRNALPPWLAVPILLFALGLGILGFISPWISAPPPFEDTVPVSATLERVEASYVRHHLHAIHFDFSDHDRLSISSKVAYKALLDKLKVYPAGTIFDMRTDGSRILALSVDGAELLSYEAACKAITFDNRMGIPVGIFMLIMAVYSIWSLLITWKYRRLT